MNIFLVAMPNFAEPGVWISLLTLTFLEIVLGVDNIIFISLVSNKLPQNKQRTARNIGLLLAMIFRSLLLLGINWIIGLKEPIFTLPFSFNPQDAELALSWKDFILLFGGIFLIVKSTLEIHHKLQVNDQENTSKQKIASSLVGAIIQIILVDAVFSFDSILTAVGLIDNVVLMIIAVIISILIMMLFAGVVTRIINKQPTLQMLALSFLVVIGVVLVAEGIHEHVSKGIIYSCLAFSLAVEALNIKLRKKHKNVVLNDSDWVKMPDSD
ncbi:MAG: TerC family protein [Bacteroidetes bacterium]|nr:TerC family protein [Bacteroidota bacterium]MBS1739279.1 TerC family protein [Bacteroidota bacterium]